MKVLMLTHEFPPTVVSGVATYCYDLADALAKRGIEVTIVAGSPPSFIKSNPAHKSTKANPRVLRVGTIPKLPPAHLWYQLMNLSAISKLVSTTDIVHGMDVDSFPMIYLSKNRNPEVPWVVTLHIGTASEAQYAVKSVGRGGTIGELLRLGLGLPAWDISFRGAVRYADAIVSVAHHTATEDKKRYRIDSRKLFTIHSGIDIERLENIARGSMSDDPKSDKVRLFWAGRFAWRKGVLQLMEALSYMVHKIGFGNFELQMFGKGPLEDRVRQFASELGLGDKVKFRGFVRYEELIASMALSDVVCFPSLYEAWPFGMMEPMSLGKPILAFMAPFSREVLGDEYRIPLARSIEDYARCLHLLCISKDLRQECQAYLQARARDHFDIKVVVEKYLDLYRKVLQ